MNRRAFFSMAPAFPAAAVSASLVLREQGKQPVELGLSVLNLQEGDRLVLTLPVSASMETLERIKAMVEQELPKVRALLFCDGMKVEGVLRGPE